MIGMPYDSFKTYLRGSKRPYKTYQQKTLRNEINLLKRKVARNTPAPVYFDTITTLPSFSASPDEFKRATIDITDDILSLTGFRDQINGDEWYNNSVKLSLTLFGETEQAWCVVYAPNLASTVFAPPESADGNVTLPDPAAFRVLSSRRINRESPKDTTTSDYPHVTYEWIVPLRSMKTLFNSDANIVEKNPIKVMILLKKGSGTAGGSAGRLGIQIQLQDK